ncbi:MAG TPA: hypothetical protein VK489_03725 [Ferruginibacter sp.]|nr:hypothetical protein [Ferruginibacter sp.]
MSIFESFDTGILIDMLAKHMDEYTRLTSDGSREEFDNCKSSIIMIQQEINSRRQIADAIL